MQNPAVFANRRYAGEVISKLRLQLLETVLILFGIASALIGIAILLISQYVWISLAVMLPATVLASIFFLLVRRGQAIGIVTNMVMISILIICTVLFWVSSDAGFLFLLLSVAMLYGALMTNTIVFRAVSFFAVVLIIWAVITANNTDSGRLIQGNSIAPILFTAAIGLIPLFIGLVTRYSISELEKTAREAQRAASLLEASAIIGQNMSQLLELNQLLANAVDTIRDRFAYYHVQIFLIDEERRYAHLNASTGEVGEKMLARGHRLALDNNSVIGRVSRASEPILTSDTLKETGHSFNELLPDTRSELALPIMDNEGVIGALDVQSRIPNAFQATEIQALQVIANQLATAIRNARLFNMQSNNIRENKRLFIDAETNLREIQRLNRQLTKQAWNDYLRMDRRITGVQLKGAEFQNQTNWTPRMVEAGTRRRPVTTVEEGKRMIAVPIELRGEVVGAIEIESDAKDNPEDAIDMVKAISQRLAVSLDNARLFEETQEATAQEQRIGEIVSLYQSADTVDELLQITLQGLAETLGAEEGAIRLGMLDVFSVDDPTASSNGEHAS